MLTQPVKQKIHHITGVVGSVIAVPADFNTENVELYFNGLKLFSSDDYRHDIEGSKITLEVNLDATDKLTFVVRYIDVEQVDPGYFVKIMEDAQNPKGVPLANNEW